MNKVSYFCNLKLKCGFVLWFQVTDTIMQKKFVLKYLLTTLLALSGTVALYAQSCSTQYAGTNFAPKQGVTTQYYSLDDVSFFDPTSETLTLGSGYTFGNKLPQSIPTATYTVTSGGLYIHCKEAGQFQFFTYSLSGLNTTSGKNSYKVEILFSAEKQNACSTSWEGHNPYVKIKCSPRADEEYKRIDFGTTYKYSYTFTAATPSQTFSFSSDYSNGCGLLVVKSIVVTGCFEKKIVSSDGNKPCAGEVFSLTAKGLNATTYKWEKSIDNGGNWTVMSQTTKTITEEAKNDALYKVSAGGESLSAISIRPMVCCAVAGKRVTETVETFTFMGARTSSPNCKYNYAPLGKVGDGYYAVVHSAKDGGHWDERNLRGHTNKGAIDDGFLLVNAGHDAISFYEQEFTGLCKNTVYDFSAFVANVCPDDGKNRILPNIGFKVYAGGVGGVELLSVESGDIPDGTDWIEKGGSFNSGNNTSVLVKIFNNVQTAGAGTIDGNDVAIDDITFSTCSPEIKVYSNPFFTSQDTTVCDNGNDVTLKLYGEAVYDLTKFFTQPWYLLQTATAKTGPWNQVGNAQTDNSFEISVPATQVNEVYYRIWVGGDENSVVNASKGIVPTDVCTITSVSDTIFTKYKCKCSPTPAPTVKNYAECPVTTGSGTVPIKSLVTSAYENLRVYESATSETDLGENFEFDAKTVGETTYYLTDQKNTVGRQEYCESERVAVRIKVKDAAVFTVSPMSVSEVCYSDLTPVEALTYTASVPSYTYTWTGTSISATGVSYTLEKKEHSGTIKVVSTDPSGTLCDASVDVTYELAPKPEFTVDAPKLVCLSNPAADITITVTTGSGHYTLKKDGVVIAEDDMSLGQTIIPITDSHVATTARTVTYEFTIKNQHGCETSEEFTIEVGDKIDIPLVPTAPVVDNNICLGQTFDINATYTLGTGESLEWSVDGVVVSGVTGTKLVNQSPVAKTNYTVKLIGGQCEGGGSLTITVDEPAHPAISADKTVVCAGTKINITDSDTNPAKKYIWYKNGTVMTDQTGKDILNYTPTETATYYKESVNGACKEKSNDVLVEVQPAIEFTLEPVDKKICVGEEVTIRMSGYPSGADLKWTEKATGVVLSTDATAVVTPTETSVYTATVTKVCEASKDLTITVLPPIDPDISDDATICEGGKTTLTVTGVGVTKVTWTPAAGLDNPTKATVEASPDRTTTYKATVSNGICEDSKEVTVTVSPLPRFEYVKELKSETCSTRGVEVAGKSGVPPYLFSDDGVEFVSETEFYGLPSGYTKFYIRDDNKCQSDTTVHFDPYPINPDRFFSPNDDGVNELWTVENLNCYEGYIVEIFDRYGKRLYIYKKGSFSGGSVTEDFTGWDGIYNGHQMPSTDYWYLITVEEIRKQYNGHFTLKR